MANPLPVDEQLDPELHDRTLADGLARLERDGVTGKAVTPYLLAHFHSATAGASLAVNVRIILRNADLAARIAVAGGGPRVPPPRHEPTASRRRRRRRGHRRGGGAGRAAGQPARTPPAAIRFSGGGQAANTAAWLAAQGVPVTLVGAVGDDDAGRDRVAELDRAGVDCAVDRGAGRADRHGHRAGRRRRAHDGQPSGARTCG